MKNTASSLRLGYNSRDSFLSDPDIRGQGTSSAYGQRFSTLDLQAGYDVSSHVNVYLEGNNCSGRRACRACAPSMARKLLAAVVGGWRSAARSGPASEVLKILVETAAAAVIFL